MKKLKILHLEDVKSDADLVNRALKKGEVSFETLVVDSKNMFVEALEGFSPDIILSDHSLPSFNSYQALEIFRESKLKIPFILITATISEDFAVDIIKHGADDYILKDRLERLPTALNNALEKFKLARDFQLNVEQLNRASQEKIVILESIKDGFYALDNNYVVTYWNKEAEHILGKQRDQVIGRNLWEVYPEAINTLSYQKFKEAVHNKQVQNFERYNDLLAKWLDINVYPSENGLSIYFKDITDKKIKDLERLSMVNDILQRNKDLEQFSYIVSHNLRAPVANIIGLAEELSYECDDVEGVIKLSSFLKDSATKLNNVITDLNQLLQVKRLIQENRELIVFSKIINEVLADIPGHLKPMGMTVALNFDEVDQVWSVKSYLYSVFYNLISNSIKFSKPNVPLIINIYARMKDRNLIIVLNDNGIGIDLLKYKDEVFGLYKRFHPHIDGKGMGLFMVRTQLETLGAKISVSSEVHIGTTFTINYLVN